MIRFILIACFLGSLATSMTAQDTPSYVDMNAAEFKSFVSKLVKAKRNTMTYKQYVLYRQIQHYKKIRANKNAYSNKIVASTLSAGTSSTARDPRLDNMESMLANIQNEQRKSASKKTTRNNISDKDLNELKEALLDEMEAMKAELNTTAAPDKIVVTAPAADADQIELYEQLANNLNALNASMQKMQSQLNEKNKVVVPNYEKELRDIKAMISKIENQKSTHTRETIQTNTISNNQQVEYLTGIIRGREISQIQFANASHTLSEDSKNTIQGIANLLNQQERIDVLIAGYTSSTGSPLFNQNLSLQRTEAVKRYLMELGIHATRIFSEYHGIDYNAADDSNARRVEMKLLVR